jgi:hypothetical protein
MKFLKFAEEKIIPALLMLMFIFTIILLLLFLVSYTNADKNSLILFAGAIFLFFLLFWSLLMLNGLNGIMRKRVYFMTPLFYKGPLIIKGIKAFYVGWSYILLGIFLIIFVVRFGLL